MIAALIVLMVFVGISLVVATTGACILVAHGRLTIPGTNMRRVQQARVDNELAKLRLERTSLEMRLDEAAQLRLDRALEPGSREPGSAIIPLQEGEPA